MVGCVMWCGDELDSGLVGVLASCGSCVLDISRCSSTFSLDLKMT
jgi:hypothetical protein